MGKIARAHGWDENGQQRFVTINPLADEVSLYQTAELDDDNQGIIKIHTRRGFTELKCIDYCPSVTGLVAVGQDDGLVKLFDVLSPQSTSLSIKQNKRCNTLSFNSQGLIAAGHEKSLKTENSLHIYNINHYSSSNINQDITHPTFSFIPNETIVSTIFYNETNLLVGSSKQMRDIDIRMSSPVFQVPTKTPFGITQDPYNQFLLAGFAEDGTLSIYDRRKLTSNSPDPLLSFSKLLGDTTRKNNTSCFRYSSSRSNEFATSHAGELIRRWKTGIIPSSKYEQIFVASVLDVKTKYDRVISFDYCETEYGRPISLICMRQSGSIFKMPITESPRACDFSSSNDLIFTGDAGTFVETVDTSLDGDFKQKLKIKDESKDDSIHKDEEESEKSSKPDYSLDEEENSEDNHEEFDDYKTEEVDNDLTLDEFFTPSEVLENDINVRMKKRAILGYGTNCVKNIEIIDNLKSVGNNLFLRSTWRWVEIAKSSTESGLMTTDDLDLSYEGILGIWKGIGDLHAQDRYKSSTMKPDVFKHQIMKILSTRNSKSMSIVKSNKEPQRRLCMIVSGWYFNSEELEQIYSRLMSTGNYTKAAGWAVFMGDITRAVTILSSSKSGRLKLIATAISGYLVQRGTIDNSLWKEQCRQMASELDDPYLRAIFAYIADNDWWDVLDESSLPLRERVGIALKCLSDKDLTIYLDRIAQRYIEKGELEGLILTGITPKGIDLLQSFVDRTSDVQTAALITSFASPRYFKDERAEHWVHCYRTLLNSWSMFSTRAKFDVARAQLSRTTKGRVTVVPPAAQVHIQCTRCNKNIFQSGNSKTGSKQRPGQQRRAKAISSCPHCGAALPRCAVCLLPLGRPLPPGDDVAGETASLRQFREWPSFCLTCNHGMHAGHAEEWFARSNVCSVPGCLCHCNSK